MDLKEYVEPQIKVCDYMAQNGLMIGIGEGTTGQNLSKEAPATFDAEAADDAAPAQHNVWDE